MCEVAFRRRLATLLACLLLALAQPVAQGRAAGWKVTLVPLPGPSEKIYFKRGKRSLYKLRVVTRDQKAYLLKRCGKTFCTALASARYIAPNIPPGALPDAVVTTGSRNIAAAWLGEPTRRYDHAILGDAIEAGSVVALDARRKRLELRLGADSVFEDRMARIVDMDGDGEDEILVVRSYLDRGAALALIRQTGHGLEIRAETPPIGTAHRWLNPAGVADFDGDGRPEAAIVVTPHIGGVLEFWELREGRFVREMQLPGFSNHAIGSRVQEMSAVADFDGDRIPDLALPAQDQRSIRLISYAKGEVAQIGRIELPGRITSEILLLPRKNASGPALVAVLHTGKLALISR